MAVAPRAWTEVVLHPDVVYGYSVARPDVCLFLRGEVLVTVLSRRYLRQARGAPRGRLCVRGRRGHNRPQLRGGAER